MSEARAKCPEGKLPSGAGSPGRFRALYAGHGVTDRDCDVLEHVARYRIATVFSFRHAALRGASRNAVCKVTSRLVRGGWLLQHRIGLRLRVYTLSPKSCCLMGVPPVPGAQAAEPGQVISFYGLLDYCCREGRERVRLTQGELQAGFPALLASGPDREGFFLDGGRRPAKCGFVWTDRGEDPAQLAEACLASWKARLRHAPFRGHVRRSGFSLVLLTATAERAAVLRRRLGSSPLPGGVTLSVEVAPCLLPLFLELEPLRACRRRGAAARHSLLVERDYRILQHLARYRIGTHASLREAFFGARSRSLAVMVCSRLVRNGWVNRHQLGPTGCYYTLAPRAAVLFGEASLAVTKPLPPRELARELCLIRHCRGEGKSRLRLTGGDLRERYGYLYGTVSDSIAYCVETRASPGRLGMVCLDHKNTPGQTVATYTDELRKLAKDKRFRALLGGPGLHVAIYSGSRQRVEGMRHMIGRQRWPQGVHVTTAVAPELMSLGTHYFERFDAESTGEMGAGEEAGGISG